MKYLLLPVVALSIVAASLTGCSNDVTRSRDIYRNEYKYKPLPQDNTQGLPATNTPPAGAGGAAPSAPGLPPAAAPQTGLPPAPAAGAPPQ